jgi:hypothetical protein
MKSKGIAALCLFALSCVSLTGCLNLQFGGKTHNCNGSKDAEARIAMLEKRINTLEHYAGMTNSSVSLASATTEAPNNSPNSRP